MLDLTKWGGSKVRKRLETIDPSGKDAYAQFFPFLAEMAKEVNTLEAASDTELALLQSIDSKLTELLSQPW